MAASAQDNKDTNANATWMAISAFTDNSLDDNDKLFFPTEDFPTLKDLLAFNKEIQAAADAGNALLP